MWSIEQPAQIATTDAAEINVDHVVRQILCGMTSVTHRQQVETLLRWVAGSDVLSLQLLPDPLGNRNRHGRLVRLQPTTNGGDLPLGDGTALVREVESVGHAAFAQADDTDVDVHDILEFHGRLKVATDRDAGPTNRPLDVVHHDAQAERTEQLMLGLLHEVEEGREMDARPQ